MQQSQTGQQSATNTSTPASWLQTGSQEAAALGQQIGSTNWTPYTGNAVAGMSGNQQLAYNNAGNSAAAYQAGGLANQSTASMTAPGALNGYVNPYTGGQVAALTQQIGQQYAPVQAGLTGALAGSGNLNSNRAGVVQGQLTEQQQNEVNNMAQGEYGGAMTAGAQAFCANRGYAAQQGADIENQLMSTGQVAQNVEQQQANFNYGQFLQSQYWGMCHQLPALEEGTAAGALGAPVTTQSIGNNALSNTSYGSAIGALAALGGLGAKALGSSGSGNIGATVCNEMCSNGEFGADIASCMGALTDSEVNNFSIGN